MVGEKRTQADGEANSQLTFWQHLDVLRGCLMRMIVAAVVAGVAAFFMKDTLFSVVLAPTDSSFFIYRWLGADPFSLKLINTGLTEQFMLHLKVATVAGVLCASPYLLYTLFGFISPALYANERRMSVLLVASAYVMFMFGVALNYLFIFPLTVRFLGTYQISNAVSNMLSVSSYIDTLLMMSLVFGIVCELPVISCLLARMSMLRSAWMSRFRRHAVVVILIVAAVITPTSDIFTLLIVALPIWILYEVSIWIVRIQEKKS